MAGRTCILIAARPAGWSHRATRRTTPHRAPWASPVSASSTRAPSRRWESHAAPPTPSAAWIRRASASAASRTLTPRPATPSASSPSARCRLSAIPCCTPFGACGMDPLGTNLMCIANPPAVHLPEAGVCDLTSCPMPDGGLKPCCQSNGSCGVDPLGIGLCLPAPPQGQCDLTACPTSPSGLRTCCQVSGLCGIDLLGLGLCFPSSFEPCNPKRCPQPEGGGAACCQSNNQCGADTLGIGICLPPAPPPTCDLAKCPASETNLKSCCLPNGDVRLRQPRHRTLPAARAAAS